MGRELDRELLAGDAYENWKCRIRSASESVRVFTPYFDRSLERLLSNSDLESDALSVVTDLSPETGAIDYRSQLLAARLLLNRGVEIRSLARLHGKVLVCDQSLVTVGSQNFTSFARRSRETTVIRKSSVEGTEFLKTLEDWYQEATVVTPELIERLLERTDLSGKALQAARLALLGDYAEEWDQYLAELEAAKRRRESLVQSPPYATQLATLVRSARDRQARQSVWARMQDAGGYSYFDTLRADRDSTFTTWHTRDDQGRSRVITLTRLQMHPIILATSGRMGFVRLGDQQISYVRDSVAWSRPINIGGVRAEVTVRFPRVKLKDSNINLALSIYGRPWEGTVNLRVRFDGAKALLIGWTADELAKASADKANPQLGEAPLLRLVDQLLESDALLSELVSWALRPFKFEKLGLENTNADDFFPGGWIQLTVIDYRDRKILVASPAN